MPITTIKVERAVRDRLAEIARGRGVSMGALLDAESRRLEADKHWSDVVARVRKRCVRDAILVAQRAGSSAAAG